MTSHSHNPLKCPRSPGEIKAKASVRYTISIVSAIIFLGWLVLELAINM